MSPNWSTIEKYLSNYWRGKMRVTTVEGSCLLIFLGLSTLGISSDKANAISFWQPSLLQGTGCCTLTFCSSIVKVIDSLLFLLVTSSALVLFSAENKMTEIHHFPIAIILIESVLFIFTRYFRTLTIVKLSTKATNVTSSVRRKINHHRTWCSRHGDSSCPFTVSKMQSHWAAISMSSVDIRKYS